MHPSPLQAFLPPIPLPTNPQPPQIPSLPRHPSLSMHLPQNSRFQTALKTWGIQIDPTNCFAPNITAIHPDPPLLRVENFISASECAALIALQSASTSESDLYLNYRVNQQVSASSTSSEAEKLLAEFPSATATLSPGSRSGFRAQVPCLASELRPVLESTRAVLGFGERQFVFEEGLWVRPSRRRVIVRDQTTVRYDVGEGVAPHVDGKDVTVLVCLQEPAVGGRTVFPEIGLAVEQKVGAALVYRSKEGLLHFAEAVGEGRKWVLQLLIDFRVREDELDVDFSTGQVFS